MFEKQRLGVLGMSFVFVCGSLFAQSSSAPPPVAGPAKVEAPSAAQLDPNGVAQAIDPRVYEIGAEDIIRIVVWQSPEFSSVQSVRPDGKISLPLVGDVQAEGLTPNRLKAALTGALKDYVELPDVTIFIQQVNSKSYRVSGWINRPGKYPLVTPIRVYEAIADAGGPREFANLKDITIFRGTQRIKFNAKDYRDGKNLDKNIWVENGDIIEIHD